MGAHRGRDESWKSASESLKKHLSQLVHDRSALGGPLELLDTPWEALGRLLGGLGGEQSCGLRAARLNKQALQLSSFLS